jgi:uncharacterized membrane protein
MFALGAIVAAYASAALFVPTLRSGIIRGHLEVRPVALAAHLAGGALALVIGAFQHNRRVRARRQLHRAMGRAYVVAVVVAGMAGLRLAPFSVGGLATHVGFGLLATLWLISTVVAFVHARRRAMAAHQVWMLRSYALTLAAVTLRIYLPLGAVAGVAYEPSYQAIAWLCWVPNLVVVEWFMRPLRR